MYFPFAKRESRDEITTSEPMERLHGFFIVFQDFRQLYILPEENSTKFSNGEGRMPPTQLSSKLYYLLILPRHHLRFQLPNFYFEVER